MIIEVSSEAETKVLGERIGQLLRGGEVIELIGDVGAGKTTLVKGIARGLEVDEYVQSPSFTISRVYDGRDGIKLYHYDFYRLHEAGIMSSELQESSQDSKGVTIIEWADVVSGVLPGDRLTIQLASTKETGRRIELTSDHSLTHALEKAVTS